MQAETGHVDVLVERIVVYFGRPLRGLFLWCQPDGIYMYIYKPRAGHARHTKSRYNVILPHL